MSNGSDVGTQIAMLQGAGVFNGGGGQMSRPLCILPNIDGIQGPFAGLSQGWASKKIGGALFTDPKGRGFSGVMSWGDIQDSFAALREAACGDVRQTDNLVAPPTPSSGGSGGTAIDI